MHLSRWLLLLTLPFTGSLLHAQDLAATCHASSSYDVTLKADNLLFDRAAPAPFHVELQQGALRTDGAAVRLNAEDQDRLALFERELRALAPGVRTVAQSGVGMAGQNAVNLQAGRACEGLKPVVAIYSTFLQRGYDQLIHDVAIQNLPVVFALDRAGIVGADGATHMGAFDIAFVRCIPNMSMLTPADENECRQALSAAFAQQHPVCVRYPRGAGAGVAVSTDLQALPWGKGEVRRTSAAPQGQRIAILAFGTLLYPALAAAEALDATVANMRFVKPLDAALLAELAQTHDAFVTLEEGCVQGGAGSAVAEALSQAGSTKPWVTLGLTDGFVEHGDPVRLMSLCGLDAPGIEKTVRERLAGMVSTAALPDASNVTALRG